MLQGSVEVSGEKGKQLLKPGQQAIYTEKGIEVKEVNAALYCSWIQDRFVFVSEELEAVTRKLERWYGVSIVNETGLVFTQSFSGEFDREDIHVAIESLCANLNITYTMDKDRIILKR